MRIFIRTSPKLSDFCHLVMCLFVAAGCTHNKDEDVSFKEGVVLKSSKAFTVPKMLKEKVELGYVDHLRAKQGGDLLTVEEVLKNPIPRGFLEIDTYFEPLGPGTLDSPRVFRSPRGGGMIDLASVVKGRKGSFFIRFKARNPDNPGEELENFKVYFLSEVHSREIDGKKYGSGCGALVDISTAIQESTDKKGLRVNVKDHRYYHTIIGTYLFVSYTDEKILLAALRIKNSALRGFECLGKD